MIRQTSIDAYHKIKDNGLLSKRRWEVYAALYHNGPCTANELFRRMSKPDILNTNVVTRLGELRNAGVVAELGERKCGVTKQRVIVWDVTDKLPKKVPKKKQPSRKDLIEALTRIANLNNLWHCDDCLPIELAKKALGIEK